jgi:cytochrome P450
MARVSARQTAAVVWGLFLPLVARGLIIRRPRVVRWLARHDADRSAIRLLGRLQSSSGAEVVRLAIPGRSFALVLRPDALDRMLRDTPEPFSPATREKRAALSHFEPAGALISEGPLRAERRRLNEDALDSACPLHRQAGPMIVGAARHEAAELVARARADGDLGWEAFQVGWWRLVRHVVFGPDARDERAITDHLEALRRAANWGWARPKRRRLRARFDRELRAAVAGAHPASLAGVLATMPASEQAVAHQQAAQWLFAFDAAGITTFRALAVLAADPHCLARAAEEAGAASAPLAELPFARACVLETLRLWPTTPAILREATEPTAWTNGQLPAGTTFVAFAPWFHRGPELGADADRFTPELWLQPDECRPRGLVPFSAGPAACPGRNVVLATCSTVIAAFAAEAPMTLRAGPDLGPGTPLPSVLDHTAVRLALGT